MFRFHKPLDIITLFHKPAIPASKTAASILQRINTAASETAVDNSAQNPIRKKQFELEITESPPTPDQLKLILDYMHAAPAGTPGVGKPGDLVQGALDRLDALRKLKEDGSSFASPVAVDWTNGKAVFATDESVILKLLNDTAAEENASEKA